MISYHSNKSGTAASFARGFRVANTFDIERLARGISQYPWSPLIWRDGVRTAKNFISSDWCALDFDDGQLSLAQAMNDFADMINIIGTTKSHQHQKNDAPACDRFRVVMRWEQTITSMDAYQHNMRYLARAFSADKMCVDGGRFFWPCAQIVSVNAEGYRQEVKATAPKPQKSQRHIPTAPSPWVMAQLRRAIPQGQRNHILYGVMKDLLRCGMDQDEVLQIIRDTPTQRVTPLSEHELGSTIRSALRSIKEETNER